MLKTVFYVMFFLLFFSINKLSVAQHFVEIEGYLIVERYVYVPIKESDVVDLDFGLTNAYFFEDLSEALENVASTMLLTSDKSLWDNNRKACVELFRLEKLKKHDFFGDELLRESCMPLVETESPRSLLYKKMQKLKLDEKKEEGKKRFYVFFRIKANVVSGEYLKTTSGRCNVYPYKEPTEKSAQLPCPFYYHEDSFEKFEYMYVIYKMPKKQK